jgi:rhodanese-related sulfurtransferase
VLLVDTRSRASYQQAHIPNAISLPLEEIEAGDKSLPKDAKLVLYCT